MRIPIDEDLCGSLIKNQTHAVAFTCKDSGADASEELAPTLRSMNDRDGNANAGGQVAVAFAQNRRGEVRQMDVAGDLASEPGMKQQTHVASLAIRGRGDGRDMEANEDGTANALLTPNGGRDGIGPGAVCNGMQVRRLTPRECERLQGFPDDYTLIPHRGKPAADGPRYKALGNSMAVPCMHWIGKRIAMVHEMIGGAQS